MKFLLFKLAVFLSVGFLICNIDHALAEKVTDAEKIQLKEKVLEMFDHAYGAYKKYAHPADELMPLSCRGRYRGSETDRGDIDEALGNFSLTLIDTLDTLVLLGYVEEFEHQVKYVIDHVTFNSDAVVSVFETNIRVLGGLLGAHSVAVALQKNRQQMKWYSNELLEKATDIADRLLAAFNTSTGIPYPKVNLRYGLHHKKSRVGHESHTCTACAGTMIMEFGALSRLTGKPIYEEKAHKAMEALWRYRSRHSDLVGTTINIHNGDWTRRDSGVGAGIDSYYEYCLKAYILLGDEEYRDKFNKHYAAIKKYIHQGYMLLDVFMHQPNRPAKGFIDALQAFWPGLQVLKGDLKPAIETHEMLYIVAKKFKFLPEAFTTNFDLHWAQHPLRPEFIESTYFLYQATKDPYYLSVGKHVIDTLENYARVKCGFAAFQDLRTLAHDDKMDSFVLAETFKYLYLLFSEESEHVIDVHDFVFTTEAHLLPLYLSVSPNSRRLNGTKEKDNPKTLLVEIEDDHSISCPNTKLHNNFRTFSEIIRKRVNSGQRNGLPSCNRQKSTFLKESIKQIKTNAKNRPRRLVASEFTITNEKHMVILKEFGIQIQKEANGKIQLLHQSANAKSTPDAEEGILFMQEMIQLAKERGEADGVVAKPRNVELVSPPFNGKTRFYGGYAQFGGDLEKIIVQSEAVETVPYRACQNIQNAVDIAGRIAVVERGDCMFIDKVRLLQRVGAKGVIIIDHQEGTSEKLAAPFGMSGDGNDDDLTIPTVFLFHVEGQELRKHMKKFQDDTPNNRIIVKLSAQSRDTAEEPAVVPTTTPPPPTNTPLPPPRPADPDSQMNENEELAAIPDEYFTVTESEVLEVSSGRKTIRTMMEYVGPDKHGELRKFLRSKIETCLNLECDGKKEVTSFTDVIEYFSRKNLKKNPNQPKDHYFQSSRGVIGEFKNGNVLMKTQSASGKSTTEDSSGDSYIDDAVSENVNDGQKPPKILNGHKEGLICFSNYGCFESLDELRKHFATMVDMEFPFDKTSNEDMVVTLLNTNSDKLINDKVLRDLDQDIKTTDNNAINNNNNINKPFEGSKDLHKDNVDFGTALDSDSKNRKSSDIHIPQVAQNVNNKDRTKNGL